MMNLCCKKFTQCYCDWNACQNCTTSIFVWLPTAVLSYLYAIILTPSHHMYNFCFSTNEYSFKETFMAYRTGFLFTVWYFVIWPCSCCNYVCLICKNHPACCQRDCPSFISDSQSLREAIGKDVEKNTLDEFNRIEVALQNVTTNRNDITIDHINNTQTYRVGNYVWV